MARLGRPPKPVLNPKRMRPILLRRTVDVAFYPAKTTKDPEKRRASRFDASPFHRKAAMEILWRNLFTEEERRAILDSEAMETASTVD